MTLQSLGICIGKIALIGCEIGKQVFDCVLQPSTDAIEVAPTEIQSCV
jgi:hypothetical protein